MITLSSFFYCDQQVIAAARQGYKAHGYELNQWLVWYSRLQARLQGLNQRATFSRADLWKVKSGNLAAINVSVFEGIQLKNLVEGTAMSRIEDFSLMNKSQHKTHHTVHSFTG